MASRKSCNYCNRKFRKGENRRKHIYAKHYFPCPYCTKWFTTDEGKSNHIFDVHLTVKCDYCDRRFEEEHMKQHCDTEHYFPCDYCDYYFPDEEERDAHERQQHLKVECIYCNEWFTEVNHMRWHCDSEHHFPCKYCNCYFPREEERDNHNREKHFPVKCDHCNRRFKAVKDMRQHRDALHRFRCNYCGFLFPSKEDREDHDRQQHLTVECDYCNKWFREGVHMRRHCDAVHHIPCDYCDYDFPSKSERDAHNEEEHRTVECCYCKKLFRLEKYMEEHQYAEKDDFPCGNCDKELSYEGARISHC